MDISIIKPEDWSPSEISEVISWQGHIPFAFSLMQILQPNCFVELGSHKGDSYFAFCDAVKHFNLATSCFAVDTWVGDEHAGFYGDEIFQKVQSRNNQQYSNFSKLIRSTFDEALQQFPEHSIDLLHIDGLHTYEAVKHDFETWRDKLSDKGIVLFHDTVVRADGFGVWKFWEEICRQYPNFEFRHSNGLGVLAVGSQAAGIFPDLFEIKEEQAEQLRFTYTTLGNSIAFSGAERLIKTERERLSNEITETKNWALSLEKLLNEERGIAGKQITELSQSVTAIQGEITDLKQALDQRDKQLAGLSKTVADYTKAVQDLKLKLKKERNKFTNLTKSTSWRITLPMRETKRWLVNPQQQVERYVEIGKKVSHKLYLAIPLSLETKVKHRQWIEKFMPGLLPTQVKQNRNVPLLPMPATWQMLLDEAKNPAELAQSIKIIASQSPKVSVIIPVYGKVEYSLRCLASIAGNVPQAAFEVIVVDDCSPDHSFEVLSKLEGIRLLRNESNQGFIRTCNAGAKTAKGEYLCFLNNDTEVTQGWLDYILQTFQDFPGTGYAGSKLVYPDGILQEAGGIIWHDGTAWNFGRNQNADLPVYNYARETDYCSGASIMIPKLLFDALGGFDELYTPAYCEDADLALKIREQGKRVIYQPLSVVIHHEGVTSGTDTTQGVKAYQVENQKKLSRRWQQRLLTYQMPGMNVDAAKDRMATRRVLVLDHRTPTPNQDSGSIDTFNILLLFREMGFQPTFIPEDNFQFMPEYTPPLQAMGIEMLYAPYCKSVEQHVQELGDRYDLVFLFRIGVARRHLETLRTYCPKAKIIFHTVDLHHLRMMREAELLNDVDKQLAADRTKESELAAMAAADMATVISSAEYEYLQQEAPGLNVRVLPFSRDIRGTTKGFHERRDIVFVGGYEHQPNVDAVKYFVNEIMPILRQQLPGVCFNIVGSKVPQEVINLAADDVKIIGFVEELEPLLDTMRISVAPLRYGAGIKGKVGSSMAVGLPVVATPLAAEGMTLTAGKNILLANDAKEFAEAVARLYQDETLWDTLSQNGIAFAERAWGSEAAWNNLSGILADIGINVMRVAQPLSLYAASKNSVFGSTEDKYLLLPIASVRSRQEYESALQVKAIKQINWVEQKLMSAVKTPAFKLNGFCFPCSRKVAFKVDKKCGGQNQGELWAPNWRETLECPHCKMNNLQRLMATIIKRELDTPTKKHVYIMEQASPLYGWAVNIFPNHELIGREYLGYGYEGLATAEGIRHEDVEKMGLHDETLDLIVSNDVFEHVPNPALAFAECARVLKVGGYMLATVPFHSNQEDSVKRAKIKDGQLQHLLPPLFHGNPVSADGSLVFTDFGWDVLNEMRAAGFSDVSVEIYASAELGHLGGGQLVFRMKKENPVVPTLKFEGEYQEKLERELALFENNEKVHDLPEIYHYWSNKYLLPMLTEAGITSIPQFFADSLIKAQIRTKNRRGRFVSIGSGNCDVEVSVVKTMVDAGHTDFILECVEINPAMLQRGKEIAKENRVLEQMQFVQADFNVWQPGLVYDGVMANHSLHHVVELEHLFDQIKQKLHPDGSFVINDMIGRNGHMRWPEALEKVNHYWQQIPDSYRYNVILKRHEPEYENWDCSNEGFEGIRAEDILPLLIKRFECEKFIGFANVIDIFIDRCFGHNFDPGLESDQAFIDNVHEDDERSIQAGQITPTHMLAVFVKSLKAQPFYSRGISPEMAVRHP